MKKHGVKYDQPVVMEKPTHHRAIKSIKTSGDEGYYRAFEGGKEFLIPKTNLEAMKELVNYKMRRRGESKFVRNPDVQQQEKKELKKFKEKLENLAERMDDYEEFELKPYEKELMENRRSTAKEIQQKLKMSEISSAERWVSIQKTKSLSLHSVSEQSISEPSISEPSISEPSISEPKEDTMRQTKSMSDEIILQSFIAQDTSVKLMVSGHFRNNKKPIFIIRQYRGGSVIRRKTADFNSNKSDEDVDILISGKFYRKTILEENTDRPTTMRFKDRKKILIDDLSKIIEDGFIDLYPTSKFDIVVGGMFVKRPSSPHYTPLVSIAVKRSRRSTSTTFLGDRFSSTESRETIMAMSTPVINNPFVKNLRKTHSAPKNKFQHREAVFSDAQEPQGFKTLLTRIDEGEEMFECPPSLRPKSSSSKGSASTEKSFIETIDEPKTNFTFPKIFSFDSLFTFKKLKKSDSSTKSTEKAPLNPIQTDVKLDVTKPTYVCIPSTSKSKTLFTFKKKVPTINNEPEFVKPNLNTKSTDTVALTPIQTDVKLQCKKEMPSIRNEPEFEEPYLNTKSTDSVLLTPIQTDVRFNVAKPTHVCLPSTSKSKTLFTFKKEVSAIETEPEFEKPYFNTKSTDTVSLTPIQTDVKFNVAKPTYVWLPSTTKGKTLFTLKKKVPTIKNEPEFVKPYLNTKSTDTVSLTPIQTDVKIDVAKPAYVCLPSTTKGKTPFTFKKKLSSIRNEPEFVKPYLNTKSTDTVSLTPIQTDVKLDVAKPAYVCLPSTTKSKTLFAFKKKVPIIKNEPEFEKPYLNTKSTETASLTPIQTVLKLDVTKSAYEYLPCTSESKTLSNTEDLRGVFLVTDKLTVDEIGTRSKKTKKPGFFKRMFKKLFSR